MNALGGQGLFGGSGYGYGNQYGQAQEYGRLEQVSLARYQLRDAYSFSISWPSKRHRISVRTFLRSHPCACVLSAADQMLCLQPDFRWRRLTVGTASRETSRRRSGCGKASMPRCRTCRTGPLRTTDNVQALLGSRRLAWPCTPVVVFVVAITTWTISGYGKDSGLSLWFLRKGSVGRDRDVLRKWIIFEWQGLIA
jgi:hypothetical protein